MVQDNMPVQRGSVGYGVAVVRRASRTNDAQMDVNDNPRQLQDARPPENTIQDNCQRRPMLGWNRKYVVQPFQVKRGSFDLARSQDTFGDGVQGKSLEYIGESVEDRSIKLAEDSEDRDSQSKATVRWRITIRHRLPSDTDANSEAVASEA